MAERKLSEIKGWKSFGLDEKHVAKLEESIGEIGLINPITINTDGRLIAGGHRLAAHRRLKLDTIAVKVLDLDEVGLQIARIDENLLHRTITALERSELLAERKRLYEQAHPEVRQGGSPGKKGGGKGRKTQPIASFASDVAAKTGGSERAVQLYAQVAKDLDPKARETIRPTAAADSITDLVKLSQLEPEQQRSVAKQIASSGETVKAATRSLKRAEQVKQVRAYVAPAGEFEVIVIDPPWQYDDTLDGSDRSRGGCPYPTMSIEEIAALEIPVAKDCAVFLWVTNSHLIDPEAYAFVADTWRRKFDLVPKQIRTWRKTRMGLGRVWRNITEHVIRFERGRPVFTTVTQTTEFEAEAGVHSAKPDRMYADVEAICAGQSRLEMFARAPRKGWVTSGAELPKKKRRLVIKDVEAA